MLISNQNFKIKEIPRLNPLGLEYIKFWKEEKIKCIEGLWVGGKWCPGNLYFYINYWHIKLNKSIYSKTKIIGKPFLRDVEWEVAYHWMEARGFSGFEFDEEFTCNRLLEPKLIINTDINYIITKGLPESCIKKDGTPKIYIPARDYLRKIHKSNLGRALFENEAKNLMMMGSRGWGKSFWVSGGIIAHQFLFDGAFSYQELKESKLTTEILVGAGESKYSKDLLAKVELGFDELEGGVKLGDTEYPAPFSKSYRGSFESNKFVIAEYDSKSGGKWTTKGSKSMIHHRSFKDNPFAGNGLRPSVAVLEEIGMFSNLEASHGALKETMQNGSNKFGSGMYLGTGGDMTGGGTVDAKKMAYNPEAYDMLSFDDIWENKGKICFFVPATLGLNEFKDKEGITNIDDSLNYLLEARKKASEAKSKTPLTDELQNRPIVPSEMFLITTGNVFPIAELKAQLGFVESSVDGNIVGTFGEMVINNKGKVEFEPDLTNKLRPCDYPMTNRDDTTGCWVIWEHPNNDSPYGYYLGGTDPYDQDKAPNSISLGSTFIIKRATPGLSTRDQVVAEYTARPATAEQHHENVRRGMVYYNGLDLYENEKNTLKMHFQHHGSLHLLAHTPTILKSTKDSNVDRVYGIHMTASIKEELEIYTRDWLLAPCGDGKLNLHFIFSAPLLKELISYNDDGNFDRVIAFMLCICNKMQFAKFISKKKEDLVKDDFINRKLFYTR